MQYAVSAHRRGAQMFWDWGAADTDTGRTCSFTTCTQQGAKCRAARYAGRCGSDSSIKGALLVLVRVSPRLGHLSYHPPCGPCRACVCAACAA
jgi:hypothetical protein